MKSIRLVHPRLPSVEELAVELTEMLRSGRLTNFSTHCKALEREVRELLGVEFAIACSSATSGLMMLLGTLPRGSEVLMPSFTFAATGQAVLWNGLVPVFVDIDPCTLNLSVSDLATKITDRSSAVLAVNTFGNPCEIDALEALCRTKKLALFFDSAHAMGSKHQGHRLGPFGNAEVFSLSATKVLPCGEGGLITTNDSEIARRMLCARNYGLSADRGDCATLGLNGKINEFAALLGVKLIGRIEESVARRNEIAEQYRTALGSCRGIGFQSIAETATSNFKDFVLVVDPESFDCDAATLKESLGRDGIETMRYFVPPLHQMSLFSREGSGLSETEKTSRAVISLPVHDHLDDADVDTVCEAIRSRERSPRLTT